MPKSKRRDKGKNQDRGGDAGDEEYVDDGASVLSVVSNSSETKNTDAGSDGSGETGADDDYEYKLSLCFKGIEQKSVKSRIDCLKSIRVGLSKKFVYDFVSERRMTLCDGLERCVKRGKGEEQVCAAACLCALLIQVGCSVEKDELFKSINQVLRNVINDPSMLFEVRCECLASLGLCAFICMEEPNDKYDLMSLFESIFRGSYRLNHSEQEPNSYHTKLNNVALVSWNLMFTILSTSEIRKYITMYLPSISSMLTGNDMELRITAGETVALMFELGIDDNNFETLAPHYNDLIELLKGLTSECSKFRAKKDKKVQRSIFRDICKTVETGEFEEFDVKISDVEKVTISSWATKIRYDSFCRVLGTGMNFHLQENPLLRDIFELEEPIYVERLLLRGYKFQKKCGYKADFKKRAQHRRKQRNNKMTMVCEDGC